MDSEQLAELAAEACDDKKATNIELFNVEKVTSLADWIIVTEGLSDVQVKAIIKSVEIRLKEEANRIPLRREGLNDARWALLDYGELIVNVLQPKERKYYDLESFWSHGSRFSYKEQQIFYNKSS